jgi:hypothetical protein
MTDCSKASHRFKYITTVSMNQLYSSHSHNHSGIAVLFWKETQNKMLSKPRRKGAMK